MRRHPGRAFGLLRDDNPAHVIPDASLKRSDRESRAKARDSDRGPWIPGHAFGPLKMTKSPAGSEPAGREGKAVASMRRRVRASANNRKTIAPYRIRAGGQ